MTHYTTCLSPYKLPPPLPHTTTQGFSERSWAVGCFREIGLSYSELIEAYVGLSRKLRLADLAQISYAVADLTMHWIDEASR